MLIDGTTELGARVARRLREETVGGADHRDAIGRAVAAAAAPFSVPLRVRLTRLDGR